jgi:type I restriction enzyme S subunit
MQLIRIAPQHLGDRLDAGYNSPDAVLARKKIAESGIPQRPLRELFGKLVCGPFGSTLTADEHAIDGDVLLVQPTNLSGGSFSVEKSWRIRSRDLVEKGLHLYPGGTFLFARAGVYPHVGVLPTAVTPATISSSMIAGLDNGQIDTHYLEAFFKSAVGTPLLYAAQKQTAQPTIGTYELEGTFVLCPSDWVQKYIGDKLRLAEKCRSVSLKSMRLAQQLIEALIAKVLSDSDINDHLRQHKSSKHQEFASFALPFSDRQDRFTGGASTSRINGHGLTERLDAGFYQKVFLDNERSIRECSIPLHSIGALAEKCNCGATPKDVVYAGSGQGLIRTTDVRPNVFLGDQVLRTNDIKVSASSAVAAIANDIVYTMSGTIGYAAVVSDTDEVFSFSNTIARARLPKNGEHDPHYVAGFFNSSFGYKQSLRLTSGGIQGHVMPNPFKGLLVPTPSPKVQRFIGDLFRRADRLERIAGKLVTAAKELVTALIEGQITEGDLQASQQALDKGNQDLDRAILTRLTSGRIDEGKKALLFPDIDALYAAIEEANVTDPSHGGTP